MVKLERKNIEKFSSHDSDETNLKATEGKSGKFDLKLGSLLVGTLLYNGNIWQFSYSEEFKNAVTFNPDKRFEKRYAQYNVPQQKQ